MLLIHPPVVKPSEPPAGIARLGAVLNGNGLPCRLLDANLEGLLHLLQHKPTADDPWTRRGVKNLSRNLTALRSSSLYHSLPRYSRAVGELNRLLQMAGGERGASVRLADYEEPHRSPLRSADLIAAAERPEESPFYSYFSSRLAGILAETPVTRVGFSLNFLSQALTTFAMIGWLKREAPSLRVVLGGGLVTSWMRRPEWGNPFAGLVDCMVDGAGEGPLLRLFGVTPTGEPNSRPDYAALPLKDYLAPGPILPYSAAAGCYWNRCSFCPERAEGNSYQPLPAQSAMAELRTLVRETRPALIHLLDSAVSPALLAAVAADPLPAPWYGFARIGGALADPDFCILLRRSGCVMLKLGLESGDQGVLDRLDKGIDLETVSRVLGNLRRAGIDVYLYLLFGTPPEGEAEARRTLDFVVRHRESISFLNLALFNMPVGYGGEDDGLVTEPFSAGDLSLYTGFRHPLGWNRGKVRRFIDGDFRKHPAVAAILRKDPPVFTSNHAPFFAMTAGSSAHLD